MKPSVPDSMEFKVVMRRLKQSRRGTIGLIEGLAIAKKRFFRDGDVSKFTALDIAIMIDWEGDPDEMINALSDTQWKIEGLSNAKN